MTVYSAQDAERRREFYERVPVESINSARRLQDLTVEMCGHGEAAMDAFEHISSALLACAPHMSLELLTAKVNSIVSFIYGTGCGGYDDEEEARPYSPTLGAEEPGSPSAGEETMHRAHCRMHRAHCTMHMHSLHNAQGSLHYAQALIAPCIVNCVVCS